MKDNPINLVIGVTGASGAIYARLLFERLTTISDQIKDCGVVFSDNAKDVWQYELGNKGYKDLPFRVYDVDDFFAPFASGSTGYESMIICPCTTGTMGRIAAGTSDNLLLRAADVILKERKKLVLVLREMPYNLIHIRNMKIITQAGGVICPASPSFYSKPPDIEKLLMTVIDRALSLAGFEIASSYRWGEEK